MMLKVICCFYVACVGDWVALVGPAAQSHQVLTVLCGLCRQQIRLRGSMICSWKSTPLKSKSILSERLPKDKVPCIIENACFSVCVDMASISDLCSTCLCTSLHVCFMFLLFSSFFFFLLLNVLNRVKHLWYLNNLKDLKFCIFAWTGSHLLISDWNRDTLSPRVWMHLRMWSVIATHWHQFLVSTTMSGSKSKWLQGAELSIFMACWCLLMIPSCWWLTKGVQSIIKY